MSSFLPETAPGSTAVFISDIFPMFLFKIGLVVLIIYISAFDIGTGKNGMLTRLKKFKRLVKLVNKYPGLNYYLLLGSTPEMGHLVFQPCRGTIR